LKKCLAQVILFRSGDQSDDGGARMNGGHNIHEDSGMALKQTGASKK
jgi:hypothetical protein